MKIIADENISLAQEAFSHFGEVILLPGREINNNILKNADALIIRSITMVNEELLKDTKVKFVGTATIGWDHIDTDYLNHRNIRYASAAGCNSDAVAEYVTSALFDIAVKQNITLSGKKIGVIGAGNIGSRVARIAAAVGMEVLLNDPPLSEQTGSSKYVPLNELFQCDIITLHVPLNMGGRYNTFHLFDGKNLSLLNENILFLNTSRGAVVDNTALLNAVKEKNLITVLDVWENEPALNKELLSAAEIGTPHIAGYSFEGKINGTLMIYEELCRNAGYDPGWKFVPGNNTENINIPDKGSFEEKINSVIKKVYDIRKDDSEFRKALTMTDNEVSQYFDKLRKDYSLRKEFTNYIIDDEEKDAPVTKALLSMRFRSREV